MKYSQIYEMAVEKADNMCCPDCSSQNSLDYADEDVLVCRCCKYSIDAEDLQSEWQDILEEEYGLD